MSIRHIKKPKVKKKMSKKNKQHNNTSESNELPAVFAQNTVSGVLKNHAIVGAENRKVLAQKVFDYCLNEGITKDARGKEVTLEMVQRQIPLMISDLRIANKNTRPTSLKGFEIVEDETVFKIVKNE